jgi:hypothetical protein
MAVRNPTQWTPPSGQGYIITIGLLNFQDNLGHLLITNLGNNIVTNPVQLIGKYVTAWSQSGV